MTIALALQWITIIINVVSIAALFIARQRLLHHNAQLIAALEVFKTWQRTDYYMQKLARLDTASPSTPTTSTTATVTPTGDAASAT